MLETIAANSYQWLTERMQTHSKATPPASTNKKLSALYQVCEATTFTA